MTLTELARSRILILGLGREGLATYNFLRTRFPANPLGIADRLPFGRLEPAVQSAVAADNNLATHLGDGYLDCLASYDVVVRSPGVPLLTPAIAAAANAGARITSHTEIFLANCPGTTIGVTGTKGKSTTASLICAILKSAGLDAHLLGNIGVPPLGLLPRLDASSYLVLELSSYQLDGICHSPHVAVMLNIVPEHLDLHGGFDNYVRAKRNITRFQTAADILVYNAMYPIPREIASASKARRLAFSLDPSALPGSYLESGHLMYRGEGGAAAPVMAAAGIMLPGQINLHNVLAAIAVAGVLGVESDVIARAVSEFKPLAYRLERVGAWRGITFYDDPLATIPEATIAALDALGPNVATLLLGGYDRGLDMSGLARRLRHSEVRTVILFPQSGARIRDAIEREHQGQTLPRRLETADMREAVAFAYANTPAGKICLHSPASPSFGLFKDYAERGDLFRRHASELGSESSER
jgi:UDP-N-acetylmuramoylalanine--D-glutamate ligase